MGFNIFENHLASAEGERIVRTYHCSKLSPALALFGLKVNGYVVVTNRRLVYLAEGSSGFGAAGDNRLYYEVPLAEVTNISMSQGTRFSLIRLIAGLLTTLVTVQVVLGLLWLMRELLGIENPYCLRGFIFVQITLAAFLIDRAARIDKESFARILLSAGSLGLIMWDARIQSTLKINSGDFLNTLALGMHSQTLPAVYSTGLTCIAFGAFGYLLWCLYWFVRRQYFEMNVTSKSNQNPSILISGFSVFGKQLINVSASMARNLSPSIDAQALFKELGAVVSDIQATGDLGIEKWSRIEGGHETNKQRQTGEEVVARRTKSWALSFCVLAIGAVIVGESIWFADMTAKRAAAMQARERMERAKDSISLLYSPNQLVPNHLAVAEKDSTAGNDLYQKGDYVSAQTHWLQATTNYEEIPHLLAPLESAGRLKTDFEKNIREVCYLERISSFDSKIEQYSQLEWSQIKVITNEADEYRAKEQGEESCNEWKKATVLLPSALRKLKVGVWMEQAEQEYIKKDLGTVIAITDKVLKEAPDNPRAIQLKDKSNEALGANRGR